MPLARKYALAAASGLGGGLDNCIDPTSKDGSARPMFPRPGSPCPGYAFPKLDYMFQKFSIYETNSNVYTIQN